jgi:hypothetical protein
MATTDDAEALLRDLINELTLSILSLQLQIELSLKDDAAVVAILENVAKAHISARDLTVRALNDLETV